MGSIGIVLWRSDRSTLSLYRGCFWVLAASSALAVSYFWPWYFLWFIPLGAALSGRFEAQVAALASAFALISYAIFPYIQRDPNATYYFVILFFAMPILCPLLMRSQVVENIPRPVAGEASKWRPRVGGGLSVVRRPAGRERGQRRERLEDRPEALEDRPEALEGRRGWGGAGAPAAWLRAGAGGAGGVGLRPAGLGLPVHLRFRGLGRVHLHI